MKRARPWRINATGSIALAASSPEAVVPAADTFLQLDRLDALVVGVHSDLEFAGYLQIAPFLPLQAKDVEAILDKAFAEWAKRHVAAGAAAKPPVRRTIYPTAKGIILKQVRPAVYGRIVGATNPASLSYLESVERRVAILEDTVSSKLNLSASSLAEELAPTNIASGTTKNPLTLFSRRGEPSLAAVQASSGLANNQPSILARSFVGSDHARWRAHVEWVLHQQLACEQAVDDVSPCNRFVGRALEHIWGYTDFRVQDSTSPEYLLANGIVEQLFLRKDKWIEIGRANAQHNLDRAADLAAQGHAVLAVRPDIPNGHAALVLPGSLTPSPSWNLRVPNSAAFLYEHPEKSYIGKPLSHSFAAAKSVDVKLYYRVP